MSTTTAPTAIPTSRGDMTTALLNAGYPEELAEAVAFGWALKTALDNGEGIPEAVTDYCMTHHEDIARITGEDEYGNPLDPSPAPTLSNALTFIKSWIS